MRNDRFPTTRHSLILAARDPESRRAAVETVAEVYWKPVYKYLRMRWGRGHEDAQDLTQDFFAGLAERELLERWDPARASFRTYLRVCLDHQAQNAQAAEARAKRGGGRGNFVSLDFGGAEREVAGASALALSPEALFHREWQRRLFELGIGDLRELCQGSDRGTQWEIFATYDLATDPAGRPSYEALAERHGLPVTTVTNALAWARRELRRLVLARLAGTTGSGGELRGEARDLFGARR